MSEEPKLVRRSINKHSTIRSGRTIGEKREKLETANERMAARQKDKRKKRLRITFVSLGFLIMVVILVVLYLIFFNKNEEGQPIRIEARTYAPSIEIIDEDASAGGKITDYMKEYIGMAESDFRDLGYQPIKAVLPVNSIREVDFYLDGYDGFIKMVTDRDTAVSVEDADRMLRYLGDQGTVEFQYIDVRVPGKAYWK